ncbi:hypothetical protein D3C81_1533940 [compost metagenome]
MGVLPGAFGGNQHARQAVMSRCNQTPLGVIHSRENIETILLKLAGNTAYPLTGHAIGLDVAMDDENRELQILVHKTAP